jgi:imidazolonepropionase-like amidohydrolase
MKYLLLLLFFFHQFCIAQTSDTTFYSIVNSDTLIGKHLTWKENLHRINYLVQFELGFFKENIHTIIETSPEGGILFHKVEGELPGKRKADEEFKVNGKMARWKNNIENDSAAFDKQFYYPIKATPGEAELLFVAMLKSTTKSIQLLPSGTRKFDILDELLISDTEGNQKKVQLVRFTGYSDYPRYNWFTYDGKFFAQLYDWIGTIEKGYEKNITPLFQRQSIKETEYYYLIRKQAAIPSGAGIAIKNCSVFDSKNGIILPAQTVIITGNKITRIGPAAGISTPKGFTVIDAKGRFLMAGLWESHAHAFEFQGPLWLAHGVTNVRDMGNREGIMELQKNIRNDISFGPDITVTSGFIDKAGTGVNTGVSIKTVEEGFHAIENYKTKCYDQIKLYDGIEPEWIAPLARKAHSLGMRVAGHIPTMLTAEEAVDMGFDEITHLPFLLKNFLIDTADKKSYRIPRLVQLQGGTVDLKSERVLQLLHKLKTKNIVIDPTLSVYEAIYTHLPGQFSKAYEPVKNNIPPDLKRQALTGAYRGGDSAIQLYAASYAKMLQLVKTLYDKGITIIAGTDGLLLQYEMEIYSEIGIPNHEVLRMATYIPASVHGKQHEYGNVDAGMIANLILIDGNPVEKMSDIRKIDIVFKDGKAYSTREILKAYGWK